MTEAYVQDGKNIAQAIMMRDRIREEVGVNGRIYISRTNKVTIHLKASGNRPEIPRAIQKVCGTNFSKNRTQSQRTSFYGQKDGFHIRVESDIPYCNGAVYFEKMVPRKQTGFTCPIET